jgi:type VI secretion system protein ImpG
MAPRHEELFTLYEEELTFIRQMGQEFADLHPEVAGRLKLQGAERSPDPHVERLIESFALLAARVRLKLEDEFPEITESLLQVVYPHYLAPVPSMSIAQFELDPDQGRISSGYEIKRHQPLLSRVPNGPECRFRTCYPVTLWPLKVGKKGVTIENGEFRAADGSRADIALVVRIETSGNIALKELELSSLRFFLKGDNRLVLPLYEALLGHCVGVGIRRPGADSPAVMLPPNHLAEVGFGKDEGLLPYSTRSHLGYRLILEYLCFPLKFLFFDVSGLERLPGLDLVNAFDLVFLLEQPPRNTQGLDDDVFRLGCTPIVNLYPKTAEPIRLDHAHTEYRVVPDTHQQRRMEVYSVDCVIGRAASGDTEYRPFYSLQHSFEGESSPTFWQMRRRATKRGTDDASEVYLTLVDLKLKPTTPAIDTLVVDVTCTDWDLPGRLAAGAEFAPLEGAASVKRAVCLEVPTPTMRPPTGGDAQWRLISHLSLNYLLGLDIDEQGSPEVLRAILELYNFSQSADVRDQVKKQIAGIAGVRTKQVMRRVGKGAMRGFARGTAITIDFDESKYGTAGVYLLSSVLEKFLALSVSINSFTQTIATSRQRSSPVKQWPPRSGYQELI